MNPIAKKPPILLASNEADVKEELTPLGVKNLGVPNWRLEDFVRTVQLKQPNMKTEKIQELYLVVYCDQKSKEWWVENAKKNAARGHTAAVYVTLSHARNMICYADGSVVILFNKTKTEKDILITKDKVKTVIWALYSKTLQWYTCTKITYLTLEQRQGLGSKQSTEIPDPKSFDGEIVLPRKIGNEKKQLLFKKPSDVELEKVLAQDFRCESVLKILIKSLFKSVSGGNPSPVSREIINRENEWISCLKSKQVWVEKEKSAFIALFLEITSNLENWRKIAAKEVDGLLLKSHEGRCRTLYCAPDGNLFILFNKSKRRDVTLGKGLDKIVKLALNFVTREWWASAATRTNAEKEERGVKLVKDIPGMLTYTYKFKYVSQKTIEDKFRMLIKYYPRDLCELLYYPDTDFTIQRKHKVLYGLFRIIIDLHKANLIHRDLKTGNIVVDYDYNCRIIDHKSVAPANFPQSLTTYYTTFHYASPEAAQQYLNYLNKRSASFVEINTKALDMWALGCIVKEVLGKEIPWWSGLTGESSPAEKVRSIIEKSPLYKSTLSSDLNKHLFEALSDHMLEIDPKKRLTAVQLEQALKEYDLKTTNA